MFEWLFANEMRIWIFIAVTILAILMVAVASLLHLTVEVAVPAALGLLVAAEYGFFLGLAAFTLLLLALYVYLGRSARVNES
jgi:hypothetical protein